MNRKERRRLEKQAQKQKKKAGLNQNTKSFTPAASGPAGVSNLLMNHAMGTTIQQQEHSLDWELQQISNQLENGFTGDALKSCEHLKSLHPQNSDVQLLSGIAHFMNQDRGQAKQCFETVIAHQPDNAQALNYLGDIAIDLDNLDLAQDYFRRASASEPNDVTTLHRLAYVLQRQENTEEAAKIYEKLIEVDPKSPEIRLNYGYAQYKNGETNQAIAEYRKAIELNPELGLAYINLGLALSELDEDEEAIASFRQGLEYHPKHVDGIFGIARCLRAQDEYDEAASFFKQGLELAPDRTQSYWELGYSLELSGDKEGGQQAYETCLKHNPDHAVARHLLDSLLGNTTETAPQAYVEELFDDYAETFDESLVKDLNYVVPELLEAKLTTLELTNAIESVLDLGGGTGLVTAAIQKHLATPNCITHGVDLSSGMLEIANQNNRYTETFVSDIAEFLNDNTRGLPAYELMLAGDVFVYIGNLTPVLTAASNRIPKGGLFLFTVERSLEEDFVLQPTGRFAHRREFVENLAIESDFNILSVDEIIPRKDGEDEINGYLVCLQKI